MHMFHLSDLQLPKVPYPWMLVAGEIAVFAVCIALLYAYFSA